MKKLSLMLGASAVAVTGMALSTAAYAQPDEIIVTATKREETLQDVPVSVSVTDAETIEQARILDILDLQSVVPSLRVSQLQNSAQTNFIIRGFGNGANNAGIEPAVGVFIDGVYRSRSLAQISDLPNIERVEVLRGPQNTLFGKNSSAGVISVVTSKPEYERSGYVEGTFGNFSQKQLKGFVTGPISDQAAFSIGGSWNQRQGYTEVPNLDTEVNDRDRYAVRGQLLLEPTDNMSWRAIVDYDKIDEVCCTVANLLDGATGDVIRALGGAIDSQNPYSYNVFLNFTPSNDVENKGLSLQGDIGLEWADLTSITSLRSSEAVRDGDIDYTSADLVASNLQHLEIETFTQEFRLSGQNGPLTWLGGLYYFDEKIKSQDSVIYGADIRNYADTLAGGLYPTLETLAGIPVGTFQAAGQGVQEFGTQDNTSYSIFGQVDFDVSDRLTATLGLSYVNDEKDVTLTQNNTDVFSQTDLFTVNGGIIPQAFFAQTFTDQTGLAATPANIAFIEGLAPGTSAAIEAGVTAALTSLRDLQFLPQLVAFPNGVENGSSSDSNTDYTVRLAYDVNDSINVYGSVATGFKSTSWNLSRDSRPTAASVAAGVALPANVFPGTRFAGPEEATVYELGLKAKFDKGTVNVAVFDQSIEGFQTNAFTGAAFTLTNAEEQSVKGIEVDAAWYPIDDLTLTFSGTFLDPEYDEYTQSPSGDISGTAPASIHETSISTSATWNWESNGYDGFIRADYQYESEVDIQDAGDAGAINAALTAAGLEGRTREINAVNASAGFSKDNFDVTVWARNVFEDEYIQSNFPSVAQPGSISGYPSAPRTYGVTLRANFN